MLRALALGLVAMAAWASLHPAVAGAGTYGVAACQPGGPAAPGWSLSPSEVPSHFEAGAGCGTSDDQFGGLYVRDSLATATSPAGASVHWTFRAPSTTRLTGLTYSRHLRTSEDLGFRAELVTGKGVVLESCAVPLAGESCALGAAGGAVTSFGSLDTDGLAVGIRCAHAAGACLNGGDGRHRAIAVVYSATVVVDDPEPPVLKTFGGTLLAGGWLRGTKTVSITGTDETGIQTLRLLRNGEEAVKETKGCDYTLPAPCADPGGDVTWNETVNTAAWPDGEHTVAAEVTDAGRNASPAGAGRTIRVDNTPPTAPGQLASDTGDGWSRSRSRTLTWAVPANSGGAPVTSAAVELCSTGTSGQTCLTHAADDLDGTRIDLPGAGEYVARVRLTDAAGNTSAPSQVELLLDDQAPAAPTLGTPQQQGTANDFVIPLQLPAGDPGPAPIDDSDGELCRADGTACVPLGPQDFVTELRTGVPEPGEWLLRAWVIDRAGNAGASAEQRITYQPPAPGPDGQPDPKPQPRPQPQPTAEPTPAPTAGPDPPARPRRPSIRLATARLTRTHLALRAQVPADATGRLTIRFKTRIKGRPFTVIRRMTLDGDDRLVLKLRLRGARKGTLVLRYTGDDAYTARTLERKVRR